MTPSGTTSRLRLAVLISGSGRTLANLLERSATGSLAATIDLVLANRDHIGGLEIAAAAGVPTVVLPRAGQPLADWSNAVFDRCRAAGVDLVVMAGFLQLLEIPADFTGRVINIHPSLLPAFGGKGFYGDHVHRAVLERGCTVSGCTVHFVDNEYDHGRIILQQAVPVLPEDDHERLAVRVFKAECDTLPAAINQLAAGELSS
ncbi:MAG: phosphoribosylglycinamide formyltransferase [Planctomycetia bacterium]|nr:phosphoribosylglycinamide formyltransferase [Planctomycetia bacterium]